MLKRLRTLLSQPWGVSLLFLLFFAAWLRLSQLGEIPVALNWDETTLGYVGKMVLTTGRDEHNHFLPRTFQSFGDYKAPLAFYITGISTTLFGLSAWAVRLPFALTGVASVAAVIWVSWRVFANRWLALASGWFLAIMPWHIVFSRVAFESGLSLFFLLTFLGGWLELRRASKPRMIWWAVAIGSVFLSICAYHSARIFMPLALLAIGIHELIFNREWLTQQTRSIAVSVGVLFLLSLPIGFTLFNNGAQRASQTTVFSQHEFVELPGVLTGNFLRHLQASFLLFGETTTLRHGTGVNGVFLFSHVFLLLIGTLFLVPTPWIPQKSSRALQLWQLLSKPFVKTVEPLSPWLWVALFLLGLLPAALGFEVPHANRAFLAVPAAVLLLSFAIHTLHGRLKEKPFSLLIGCTVLISLLELGVFWNVYRTQYPLSSSKDWLDGYNQAIEVATRAQLQGKTVKFSSNYGEPEIFFAFSQNTPFETYRWQRIPGVTFGSVTLQDLETFEVVIAGETDRKALPQEQSTIQRKDGTPAFFIYEH